MNTDAAKDSIYRQSALGQVRYMVDRNNDIDITSFAVMPQLVELLATLDDASNIRRDGDVFVVGRCRCKLHFFPMDLKHRNLGNAEVLLAGTKQQVFEVTF